MRKGLLKTPLARALKVQSPRIHIPSNDLVIPDQFIGVEHEVEINAARGRRRAGPDDLIDGWEIHEDGSLRNGIEFVFDGPAVGGEVIKRLKDFEEKAKEQEYVSSFRTSTHVHVGFSATKPYANIPEDTLDRIQNFLCLYFVMEDAFFGFAADDRKYCGYCAPFSACTDDFVAIVSAESDKEFINAIKNSTRYYGCNPKSLQKYGTIEFRHLPLTISAEAMTEWINSILRMKVFAYTNIEEDPYKTIKVTGLEALCRYIFADKAERALGFITQAEFDSRLEILAGICTEPRKYPKTRRDIAESPYVKAFFTRHKSEYMLLGLADRDYLAEVNRAGGYVVPEKLVKESKDKVIEDADDTLPDDPFRLVINRAAALPAPPRWDEAPREVPRRARPLQRVEETNAQREALARNRVIRINNTGAI